MVIGSTNRGVLDLFVDWYIGVIDLNGVFETYFGIFKEISGLKTKLGEILFFKTFSVG